MSEPLIPTNTLYISIKSPENVLYEGTAEALTSINERGRFDLLAQHANFISIIKDVIVVHLKNGEKKEFKIEQGVLKVTENIVHIFLGIERIEKLN